MLLLLLAACISAPDDSPIGTFEGLWTEFDERYGGFHQRDVDWDAAWDTHRPMVTDDMSDEELFDVIGQMLAVTDDGHVRIVGPGEEIFHANTIYRDELFAGTFDDALIEDEYLTDPDRGPWEWYLTGELAEDLPYVWFPGIDDNVEVIDQIADEYPDAKALILDLRHSRGGAFTYVLSRMGRILPEELYIYRSRSRNGPERTDYDEWFEWRMEPAEPYWGPPITVLQDGVTVSASERLLMVLRLLPDTTFIGTRSNGSLATSISLEANNGWAYQLPVQEVEGPEGEVWEGVGLPVDYEMVNDPAVVAAGTDTVLEFAMDLALQ